MYGNVFQKTCPAYKTTCSIRSGSIFEDYRAELDLVIFAVYLWMVGTVTEVGLSAYRTF
jgi:hypothetical protein